VLNWKQLNIAHEFNVLLTRLEAKRDNLARALPLPAITIQRIKEELAVEWTYNSNSIEGNTLTLQETKMVLQDGMTVKGKSLREHFEAVNHHDAVHHIVSIARPGYQLIEHDILHTHALVLDKIEKDFAGRFRTAGVRIIGANFTPPNALKVYDMVHELKHWVNDEATQMHPMVKATVFHHRFVWIHPFFFDGNGRTVRLLFNLLMMKDGYPPAIILRNDRKKYYTALNEANEGNYGKLLLLVCQAMERSLDIYLSNLDNYADEYKPISDIVAEDAAPYGQEYLSLLARRGALDAYKKGNVWYTRKASVDEYMQQRKRKRKTAVS
jgi:Fic family protein